MHECRVTTAPLVILCGAVLAALCAVAEDSPATNIDPDGIAGKLFICGGGELPSEVISRFVRLAGGEQARLVVIPTASGSTDTLQGERLVKLWRERGMPSVEVLHTRSSDEANNADFVKPLQQATAVWFGGGQQSRIADAYVGTAVERELYKLLGRGGVIGGTSAGAAIQSKLMIARGNPEAVVARGFDLLPDSVIDQHFRQRNRQPRLLGVLATHPGYVGFGVDEETALIVEGRRLTVLGNHGVAVFLSSSSNRSAREIELKAGDVADLTALRRSARDRAKEALPPFGARAVAVDKGSLILGGGGRLPEMIPRRFIELAGGPDALIVVLPTAAPDPLPRRIGEAAMLRRAGAQNVVVLRSRNRDEVEGDEFTTALQQAGGVWFGGGRQWRFVDAYEGTTALHLMREVLRRGGVIGGSSAGASIQAEYLARGNPLGNLEIMADGYERGFGFLPGVAVDQHFQQRGRFADMAKLVETYPRLLGIGIDESTALLVQGHVATVLGTNHVHFYDRRQHSSEHDGDHVSLSADEQYDLNSRRKIAAAGM